MAGNIHTRTLEKQNMRTQTFLADAKAPINIKHEAEGNLHTQTESISPKQAFENMKQKLKSGVPSLKQK